MNRKAKFIVFFIVITFFTFLAVWASHLFIKGGIFASEPEERGQVFDQVKSDFDINGNGKKEKVFVTTYKNGDKYSSYFSYQDSFFSKKEINSAGFENEVKFCTDPKIKTEENKEIVCLFGYVGVHSENIELIIEQNGELKVIQFSKENNFSSNIASDAPNFALKKDEQSKKIIFYIDNRNYNKNPLIDNIRDYYYFSNDTFIFEKSEEFIANVNEGENQGVVN